MGLMKNEMRRRIENEKIRGQESLEVGKKYMQEDDDDLREVELLEDSEFNLDSIIPDDNPISLQDIPDEADEIENASQNWAEQILIQIEELF